MACHVLSSLIGWLVVHGTGVAGFAQVRQELINSGAVRTLRHRSTTHRSPGIQSPVSERAASLTVKTNIDRMNSDLSTGGIDIAARGMQW